MIFDTDVLIWAQRDKSNAVDLLESASTRRFSIVSYMEFIQSSKDKRMLSKCKDFFNTFAFELLPITPDVSHRAAVFIELFSLSHNLEIPDAFIAATAFEHGMPLATSNYKDYSMIKGLEIVRLHVK